MSGWFIIMVMTINGLPQPDLLKQIATSRTYSSHAACMDKARQVAEGAVIVGDQQGAVIHGKYLCMVHNESDAALARTRKVAF